MTRSRSTLSASLYLALGAVLATASAVQAQLSVDAAFTLYCSAPSNNSYVCVPPVSLTLTATEKYALMGQYCASFLTAPPCDTFGSIKAPLLLAFDHARQKWHPGDERRFLSRIENDAPRGSPTVKLGKREPLGVVVTHTNPALFSASLSLGKIEEASELAGAKAFLAALGAASSSLISAAAISTPALSGPDAAATAYKAMIAGVPPAVPTPLVLVALRQSAASVEERVRRLKGLEKAAQAARAQLDEVESASQLGESARLFSKTGEAMFVIRLFYDPDVEAWHRDWTGLLADFGALSTSCKAFWTSGSPNESPDQALMGYAKRAAEISCSLPIASRPLWEGVLGLDPAVQSTLLTGLAKLKDTLAAAEALVKAVGDKSPALAAGALRSALHRVRSVTARVAPVQLWSPLVEEGNLLKIGDAVTLQVADRIFVAEETVTVRWDRVATYNLKVARRKAVGETVTTDLQGDTTATFKAQRSGLSALGFSVGVLASASARVSKWDVTGTDEARLVSKVEDSGRAGRIASFMNVKLLDLLTPGLEKFPLKPGIELGAAFDSANSGLLAGVSLEVMRVVRIGYGIGWWRLPTLVGASEDKPPPDDYTIRTRDRFARAGNYWSVTLALDALSVFSK